MGQAAKRKTGDRRISSINKSKEYFPKWWKVVMNPMIQSGKKHKKQQIQEKVRVPLDCPTAWNLSWNFQAEIRGWLSETDHFFKKLLL